jgi:hypothetical protein
MKKDIVIIITLLTIDFNLHSQSINLAYNYSQVGTNIRLGYELRLIPNLYIEPGIKYIAWMGVTDNKGYSFKDRFRPINFVEHWGLFTSLKYQIFKNDNFNIKLYYNGAITNCHLITDELLYFDFSVYDNQGNPINKDLYYREFWVRPKTFAFENYIGSEFNFKISNKLSSFGQLGLGYTWYHIQDEPNTVIFEHNKGEYSWFMGTIGLKYHLK